jgi:hypothetical protein
MKKGQSRVFIDCSGLKGAKDGEEYVDADFICEIDLSANIVKLITSINFEDQCSFIFDLQRFRNDLKSFIDFYPKMFKYRLNMEDDSGCDGGIDFRICSGKGHIDVVNEVGDTFYLLTSEIELMNFFNDLFDFFDISKKD